MGLLYGIVTAPLHEISRFCHSQRDWTIETIRRLVAHESPTTDKRAVDACGRLLADLLRHHGAEVERLPSEVVGDRLLASFGSGRRQLLLLGHFDTVWPVGQLARMPIREEDGRLYGPGTYDMKAGITVALLAVRALLEVGPPPDARMVMLLTTDEETGSAASRTLVEEVARRSDAVFVPEPPLPGGGAKTSRKGGGEFELVVRGVSAHAGVDPDSGASAIHELVRQLERILALANRDRGVQINVGTIAGGTRPNVVAEEARARIDVRVPTSRDAAEVVARMRALAPENPGTRLEVSGGLDRPPMERTEAIGRLYAIARDIAAALGHDLAEGTTGGGSDGSFTAAVGAPTLDGIGVIGAGAHALHEHILVESLPWRAALIAGLLLRAPAR